MYNNKRSFLFLLLQVLLTNNTCVYFNIFNAELFASFTAVKGSELVCGASYPIYVHPEKNHQNSQRLSASFILCSFSNIQLKR